MKNLLKNIENEVSILISNNEELGLYSLKYIADLVLNNSVKKLILIDVSSNTFEYFKVLLPSSQIENNPTEELLKEYLNKYVVVSIGLTILSNEFNHFKDSKNNSILFVDSLGIFREGLISHYKNIHFIEEKFSEYIKVDISKNEVLPEPKVLKDFDSIFVNRKKEINKLTEALSQGHFRGVKVVGMPGIGKRSLITELKTQGVLNENCFEFHFQDDIDRLEDILAFLFSSFGITTNLDRIENYDLGHRKTNELLKNFYKAFDNLYNANLIFYNIQHICGEGSKISNHNISTFFKKFLSRNTYKGNKIIFVSDINFKFDVDSELKTLQLPLGVLQAKHIKDLMAYEFGKRGYSEFADRISNIEEKILTESVNGHPQVAKLFVKVAETYGVENLLIDSKLKKHFKEEHKITYLLSKIDINSDEQRVLETLSLFSDFIEFKFISTFQNYPPHIIEGLINKFLLEKIILDNGVMKYYVPTLIKDVIKAKISEQNFVAGHNKIGDYYWDISENLSQRSPEILNGYRKSFFHYTEAKNLEKIKILSLRFKFKLIQKAYSLFRKRVFSGAWNLFNEIYKEGNLFSAKHIVKYLEAEIIIAKQGENTLLKIKKAIDDFPENIELKIVYAKYMLSKGNFIGAKEICEDLLQGVFPSKNNKLNLLYPRVLLKSKGFDEAKSILEKLISHLKGKLANNRYAKYSLISAYSMYVDVGIREIEDKKTIVKNSIRNLERLGHEDERLYKLVEAESELTFEIIENYKTVYRNSNRSLESFVNYLIRKERTELLDSIVNDLKKDPPLEMPKVDDLMVRNWVEKTKREDELYFYVKNKMSINPNFSFEKFSELENYINKNKAIIEELLECYRHANSLNPSLSISFKLDFIYLLELKELFFNLDRIIFLSKNEKEKRKYLGFNLRNIVYVEGETDELYIKKAAKVLQRNHIDALIIWIGNFDKSGNVRFSGDTALNQTFNYYKSNSQVLSENKRIILLYDSDTNKPSIDYKNLFVRKMKKNDSNTIFKIGVENLLNIPEELNIDDFYSTKTKTDEYGGSSIVKKLNKKKLCDWICNELPIPKQKKIFHEFNSIFDLIEEILNKEIENTADNNA